MSFVVRPLGKRFAGEISALDLSREMNAETWDALYRAYLDYKVLSIRGQSLTARQFQTFGECFGPVEPHTVAIFRHPELPAITVLSNRVEMGRPKGIRDAGSHWHSDYSYKQVPANATLLYAVEVPDEGGDTLFADLAAAYEALPEDVKRQIDGSYARHQYRWNPDQHHPEGRWRLLSEEEREQTPEVIHPVVRLHPETGVRSIYVFPGITSGVKGIVDLPDEESDALLAVLYQHCTQERFLFRYKWREGDVVLWDNRATMHCATTDTLAPDCYRTLWRLNTTGSSPLPGLASSCAE
jgi:taurine dioxygenase